MQSYKTAGFRGSSDAVSFSKECWKIDMCNPEIYTALHNLIYNVLLTSPPAFQHPEHLVVVEMDYAQVPVNVTAKWTPIPHKDTMHPDIKNASQWAMIKKQYQCNGISSPYTVLPVVVAVKVTTWFGRFS
ncbi:hypothetical protein BT96DRAFT_410800 [Gymnopus androsaceus JB14]|uniref:Uncharacterized protein n=1 Tax=Gymnopus androsaceus JB14 TaxID=1447944 RepID=A0A6A4I259_9AGAR|nr:hypothetical protein BT96DRAFT_410800 [Gymnopus androsaceus JB14]